MKIVFMGTPNFAVPCLDVLLDSTHDIVGVVSQPDRPKGRGRKLQATPVAATAREAGVPVFQWAKLNQDSYEQLKALSADLYIVVAYGKILPKRYLELPALGCWNIHASILPNLRGAAPIQWALIEGLDKTGVSLMQLDEGMDTGPVGLIQTLVIEPEDTASTLHDRLSLLGAKTLRAGLDKISDGTLSFSPQDHRCATHARMLTKADGIVDWSLSAQTLVRRFKGMSPWPGCRAEAYDEQLKIIDMRLTKGNGPVGTILDINGEGMTIACGEGAVLCTRVQRPNRGPVSAQEYARGVGLEVGRLFL